MKKLVTIVTLTTLLGTAYRFAPRNADLPPDLQYSRADRLSYIGQVLVASKISSVLSLQIMPTWVHRNMVDQTIEKNNQWALGLGGRLKISPSVAFTVDYYYRINPVVSDPYHNALGFGIDIETGGHVFQLVITNTRGLTERSFVAETLDTFMNGGIHLGFNVTRAFQVNH